MGAICPSPRRSLPSHIPRVCGVGEGAQHGQKEGFTLHPRGSSPQHTVSLQPALLAGRTISILLKFLMLVAFLNGTATEAMAVQKSKGMRVHHCSDINCTGAFFPPPPNSLYFKIIIIKKIHSLFIAEIEIPHIIKSWILSCRHWISFFV